MEHLTVNFSQKIAQIATQKQFMKVNTRMDYAINVVDWKVIGDIDHLSSRPRILKGQIIEKFMRHKV